MKLLSLVYIFENLNRFKQYLKDKAGENGEDDEEAESLLIQFEENVFIDKKILFLGTFDTLIKVIKDIQKENLYELDENSIFFLIILPEWIEKETLKSNSDFLDFSTPRKANRYTNIKNHLKNSIEGLKLLILIKRNDFDYSDVENKLVGNELSIMT